MNIKKHKNKKKAGKFYYTLFSIFKKIIITRPYSHPPEENRRNYSISYFPLSPFLISRITIFQTKS